MAVETPWQQALRNANRANPYPFYEELRKTPVSRQPDGTYVVSTYRELVAAAPRPPGQLGSPGSARGRSRTAGPLEATIITEDPSEHDRGSPPDDAALRAAGVSPHDRRLGAGDPPHRHRAAGRHEGQDPDRRRRRVRLPGAGDRDLQGPGRAAGGHPALPRLDRGSPGRGGLRPGGERPGAAAPRSGGSRPGGRVQAVPGRPDRPVPQAARTGHVLGDGQRRRPGGAPAPGVDRQQRAAHALRRA